MLVGHAVVLFILAAKRVSWRWNRRKTASTPLSLSPLVRTTLARPPVHHGVRVRARNEVGGILHDMLANLKDEQKP